jgi:hypothetical protein
VHTRSAQEQLRRRAAQALRCQGVLPLAWLDDELRGSLQPLTCDDDAWLAGASAELRVTPTGRYHLDALCALVEGPADGPGSSPCQA